MHNKRERFIREIKQFSVAIIYNSEEISKVIDGIYSVFNSRNKLVKLVIFKRLCDTDHHHHKNKRLQIIFRNCKKYLHRGANNSIMPFRFVSLRFFLFFFFCFVPFLTILFSFVFRFVFFGSFRCFSPCFHFVFFFKHSYAFTPHFMQISTHIHNIHVKWIVNKRYI